MRLTPPQPPGRANRKAREFETEIAQLRSEGYTLEAIRQALAAAGIQVSTSAVWREARRAAKASSAQLERDVSGKCPTPQSSPRAPPEASGPPSSHGVRGAEPARPSKEAAEAFALRHSSNPFIRSKDQS